MGLQFKRNYELNLTSPDGKVVTSRDLRIVFEVTKDLFGYPNLATISLYNLSLQRISQITEEFTGVELKAGYQGVNTLLFKGDVRNIVNRRDGTDTITEFFAGDGERKIRETKFSKTFASGTSVKQMVLDMAGSFGIPKAKMDGLDVSRATLNGASFSGSTKDLLDKLGDDYGFYWSIQDGQFVTQGRDSYDESNRKIIITRSTGMIGSPSITELGADVRTLLNPEYQPYRLIEIKSPNAEIKVGNLFFRKNPPTLGSGLFRINKVTHKGDSRGNEWSSSIVGRRV